MTNHNDPPKVFLSYAAADGAWAQEFTHHLRGHGTDVVSAGDIAWGQSWVDAIERGLRDSDVIVILYRDDSPSRPDVLFELGAAMAGGKLVIPVVYSDLSTLPVPVRDVRAVRKESPAGTAAAVARAIATIAPPADRRAAPGR
jgi:hypothetical protein